MIKLVSVLHDPESRLFDLARDNIGKLRYLFGTFTIVVSRKTSSMMLTLLKDMGISLVYDDGSMFLAYREALKIGALSPADYVMLVDFDKLLVWADQQFDELAKVKETEGYDYLLLERTQDAFRTHPPLQLETEYMCNFYLSKLFGFAETKDFFSGAWFFSKEVAWHIVESSTVENNGFYGEWHARAREKAKNIGFAQCNGLEWETPYQYRKEIDSIGMEAWMKVFEEKDKGHRMGNFYLILKEVMKLTDGKFKEIALTSGRQ